jgi:hypothetical protein
MIPPKVVDEVRRLLAEQKLSNRRIAELTGICRGSVQAIASGRRSDRDPQPADEPAGPPQRCPDCGGMVYMPCRLCSLRHKTTQKQRSAPQRKTVEIGVPLEFELQTEHYARFEEVRTRRRELGYVEVY